MLQENGSVVLKDVTFCACYILRLCSIFKILSTKWKKTLLERLRLQKVYELIQVEHSASISQIINCTLQRECNDNMK